MLVEKFNKLFSLGLRSEGNIPDEYSYYKNSCAHTKYISIYIYFMYVAYTLIIEQNRNANKYTNTIISIIK